MKNWTVLVSDKGNFLSDIILYDNNKKMVTHEQNLKSYLLEETIINLIIRYNLRDNDIIQRGLSKISIDNYFRKNKLI